MTLNSRTVRVPNISCAHCVRTIERELGELQGVCSVQASESSRTVRLEWQDPPASWEVIERRLQEIDYPPQEA